LFFTLIGLLFILVGAGLALPVFLEYLDTGQVRRFPTAFLSFSLGIIAVVCFATGLILDLVAHVRRESKKLAYLSYEAPRAKARPAAQQAKSARASLGG
jgi:Ca2+/H+ antiporter